MRTNLKKKALLPLIAMVLVSVISLTGVTYAWFTQSDTAAVNSLNVTVKEATGIQVSLDAENWASLFTMNDFANVATQYPSNTNAMPSAAKINPVSTSGVVTDGKLSMFLGTLLATNNLKIDVQNDKDNTNYIAFDMFFKLSEAKTIYLDPASTVDGSSVSAARVAFIDLGSEDNASDARALGAGVSGNAVIYEPGVSSVTSYAGLSAESGAEGVATRNGFVEAGANAEIVTGIKNNASDISFDFDAGINKLRVYIWLEGQDPECLNEIAAGSIAASLQFTQVNPNA